MFKGHLPFQSEGQLNGFVDHVLGIRRNDFIPRLELYSNQLVDHGKTLAAKAGRPYEYRQGSFRKEAWAHDIVRRDRLTEGLVGVLCVQETCGTVKLMHAKGRPQRVLYYYFLDHEFGLMHVRLQT